MEVGQVDVYRAGAVAALFLAVDADYLVTFRNDVRRAHIAVVDNYVAQPDFALRGYVEQEPGAERFGTGKTLGIDVHT